MSNFKKFKTNHKVRPDDIDMFNHVHNSKYLDYVLAARYEQMELYYGMSMEKFLELGYGWVVHKVHIEYKRPLQLSDTFEVETGIVDITSRGCKVEFTITNLKTNKTSTIGWFYFIMINLKTGKSISIPEEVVKLYSI
ncbi:acyl-CoA thioesterase [Pseudopedobacter beijingensis]|uniref:Acyl-CoA thioesterase n=1 Tax=Pseudopedobacter beijingensis TaxID=1207056 RepID=A0ABW4IEQ4_9SPHI